MKDSGNAPLALPKYPAMLTHGMPGLVLGGGFIGLIFFNHIVHSVWNVLPDIVSLAIMTFGLAWAYSAIRIKTHSLVKNDDEDYAAFIGLCFGIILSIVGFVSFVISWCSGHPGPPGPTYDNSCQKHGGYHDRVSKFNNNEAPYMITCNDGYSFDP